MRFRNHVNQEQLVFDLEINMTLRQIRQRKRCEQKFLKAEKDSGVNMVDTNLDERENPQPRRILGDYATQWSSGDENYLFDSHK